MPNVGFGEIFVLFLVLLLVVGPAKLPEIARNLGKAYRTFTSEMQKAQDALRVTVDEPVTPVPPPGGGVIDVPDGYAPAATAAAEVAPATAEVAPTPPSPEQPPAPSEPADAPSVVREYEDT